MKFLSETVIRKHEFNNLILEHAKHELIECLLKQTKQIRKELKDDVILDKIKSDVTFTIYDTNKPHAFTDKRSRFKYDAYNSEGNCGIVAEYELNI